MWSILKPLISPIVGKLIDKIPDKAEQEKAKMEMYVELSKVFSNIDTQQAEINKIEAQNPNLFVSGWRPFIGWVCGVSIVWTFLLCPIISYTCLAFGMATTLPQIPTENLLELVFAMLGMSGLRSFEKIRGVANR